ncbi:hypothetical protein C8J34_12212 [Rhizobium sp. PP-F2F-G36]|nr:hypothetical protein C8J34_12212 [Rhizobium sp. PP-F2F-G36]
MERGQRERDQRQTQRSPLVLTPHRLPDDPQAKPEEPQAGASGRQGWRVGWAALAGLVVAAGIGIATQPRSSGDQMLTDIAKAERMKAFKAHGPLQLSRVPDAARAETLRQMGMAPQARQALERDLDEGRVHLGWLTLWDDQVQDGDAISVAGAGFSRTIALTKQPQQIAVPIGASGDPFVVTGVRDGGAGITVAATSNSSRVPLPVMAPGETFDLYLSGV